MSSNFVQHRKCLFNSDKLVDSKETNMSSSKEPLMESKPPSPSPPSDDEEEEEEEFLNDDDDDPVINYGFSEKERRVARILLRLPELISICPRVSLIGKPSWLRKKKRSVINILSAPPPSPRDDATTIEARDGLMKEIYDLTDRKNVFKQELEKIMIYQEKQRTFNLVLKGIKEAILQEGKKPKASSNTSKKVEVDHNRQVLKLGGEPSSANGLEAPDQDQGLICNGDGPSSARVEADANEELLRADEVLENLEVDQEQGLPCGNEPPSANGLEAPDQNQGLLCNGDGPSSERVDADENEEPVCTDRRIRRKSRS